MKKLYFLFSVIVFAACADNDSVVSPPPASRLLTVEVGETPLTDDVNASRRTAAATTTETLASFALYYQNDQYNFTKTGSIWSPDVVNPWPVPDDSKIDFYACNNGIYVYNNVAPYVAFTMDEDAFHQKDFLVATHKAIAYSDDNGKVSLTFDHACAAVQFQICKTQAVNEKTIAVTSVKLKNVCKRGYYYFDSGWALGNMDDDRTDYTLTNTSIDLTTDYQLLPCQWLFIIPQLRSDVNVEIKYTIDHGAEQTKVISAGTGSWVMGSQYTVNIRVGSSFIN